MKNLPSSTVSSALSSMSNAASQSLYHINVVAAEAAVAEVEVVVVVVVAVAVVAVIL